MVIPPIMETEDLTNDLNTSPLSEFATSLMVVDHGPISATNDPAHYATSDPIQVIPPFILNQPMSSNKPISASPVQFYPPQSNPIDSFMAEARQTFLSHFRPSTSKNPKNHSSSLRRTNKPRNPLTPIEISSSNDIGSGHQKKEADQ